MSDEKTPSAERPRRGWWKPVLIVSLALNLAIIGLLAGSMLGQDRRVDAPPPLRSLGLGPFSTLLPRDERSDLRDRLRDRGGELRREQRAIGGTLLRMRDILITDPFDRSAAETALAQSRQSATRLLELGHDALLDHLETMSLAEREALAEDLAEHVSRRGRRRH